MFFYLYILRFEAVLVVMLVVTLVHQMGRFKEARGDIRDEG